ncbi:MAG: triose-phosphate isomerase [Devosiaceae bacterium]|nr:triose-phosphate isomerase [Devosiaceae bacterium MH13]
MPTSGIRPLVAGNWKMNGLRRSMDTIEALSTRANEEGVLEALDMLVCPPATLISLAVKTVDTTPIHIGAQSCHPAESGAHTGDVAPEMLRDVGASYVITGHSERRADHGETDADVNAQSVGAWRAGLCAIVCVGETREEREAGRAVDVVVGQLAGSVPDGATAENTVIAYEPVWAIGTGLTPTVEDIAQIHAAIRQSVADRFGAEGEAMRLLYGGSVKPGNAAEVLSPAHVDGALVGGASLSASDFMGIATAVKGLVDA